MTQNSPFDQSIPVLTEVFSDKPATLRRAEQAAPQQDELNAHLEARAVEGWTEPEWNLLERRLSERILQQLQGRVDFVLEHRLRDAMEDVLAKAMASLTAEIREGLQQTIASIVARAVAQEVTHLQTLKK